MPYLSQPAVSEIYTIHDWNNTQYELCNNVKVVPNKLQRHNQGSSKTLRSDVMTNELHVPVYFFFSPSSSSPVRLRHRLTLQV